MLVLRRTKIMYSESDGDTLDVISASVDPLGYRNREKVSLFPHRVLSVADAFDLLGNVNKAQYDRLVVRGYWNGTDDELEVLLESLDKKEMMFELTFHQFDQVFQIVADLDAVEPMSSICLPDWGDYAFAACFGEPCSLKDDSTVGIPTKLLRDQSMELVELAWGRAYEIHGVFCNNVDAIYEAIERSPNVMLMQGSANIGELELLGEGRSTNDLFFK